MRAQGDVLWIEQEPYRPFWAVLRHKDIMEIERNSKVWLNAQRLTLLPAWFEDRTIAQFGSRTGPVRTLLDMDEPDHRKRLKDAILFAGIVDLQDTIINRGGYQNIGHKAAEMLRLIPEAQIDVIERCSGHGGVWGARTENFDVAVKAIAADCPIAVVTRTSTPGCRLWKSGRRGISQRMAKVLRQATSSRVSSPLAMMRTASSTSSRRWSGRSGQRSPGEPGLGQREAGAFDLLFERHALDGASCFGADLEGDVCCAEGLGERE